MMADVVDLSSHEKFRKHFPAVDLPSSFTMVAETLGLQAGNPVAFWFRRVGIGTEIWLIFNSGFRLNLSNHESNYPQNIASARQYASQFAARHGFQYQEVKKERARPGELTKPERQELARMISWRKRFWRWQPYYKPENQSQRRACDLLVHRGLATEHIIRKNSYVEHNGDLRLQPYFLATDAGVEWAITTTG